VELLLLLLSGEEQDPRLNRLESVQRMTGALHGPCRAPADITLFHRNRAGVSGGGGKPHGLKHKI